jgi:cytochrome c553
MKSAFCVVTLAIAAACSANAADPPAWAYGFATGLSSAAPAGGGRGGSGGGRGAGRGPQAPDTTMLHVDGSTLEFTRAQASDGFGPADWFPGDHPPMPEIVAHGRRPDIRACGLCHYPNGKGRAENAGVSGLSVEYFIQQLKEFAAGNRKSSDTRKANTNAMASLARAMTDDEMKAAA